MDSDGNSGSTVRISAFDCRYVVGKLVCYSFCITVRTFGFYLYVRSGKSEGTELAETYYWIIEWYSFRCIRLFRIDRYCSVDSETVWSSGGREWIGRKYRAGYYGIAYHNYGDGCDEKLSACYAGGEFGIRSFAMADYISGSDSLFYFGDYFRSSTWHRTGYRWNNGGVNGDG